MEKFKHPITQILETINIEKKEPKIYTLSIGKTTESYGEFLMDKKGFGKIVDDESTLIYEHREYMTGSKFEPLTVWFRKSVVSYMSNDFYIDNELHKAISQVLKEIENVKD